MDIPEGMIAVVRGMPDSALAVTLFDGGRQYSLLSNNDCKSGPQYVSQKQPLPSEENNPAPVKSKQKSNSHYSRGAQAMDDQYTSVYKMAHCNVKPTSPPVEVAEFPPQRAELCPGEGNFEIGGYGSSKSHSPIRTSNSFRGGMTWPERGSVCSPRQSHEPDAFANSLRKYPNLERSELIEQAKIRARNYSPPTRCDSGYSQSPERQSWVSSHMNTQRINNIDIHRPRVPDDSPTKDITKQSDVDAEDFKKALFGNYYDVRCMPELNKKIKDSVKQCPTYARNAVHMETQAKIHMISKEIITAPTEQPETRNVGVPLSPLQSESGLQQSSPSLEWKTVSFCKSIQTHEAVDLTLKTKTSVQTCISSLNIQKSKCSINHNQRKTKSQDDLRANNDLKEDLLRIISEYSCSDDEAESNIRNAMLRKLRKINKMERAGGSKIKSQRKIRDYLCSQLNLKKITRELSDEIISNVKHNLTLSVDNSVFVFKATTDATQNTDRNVDNVIKECFDKIPLKSSDYLGRLVTKENLSQSVANKIKHIIKHNRNGHASLKSSVYDLFVEEIPVDIQTCNKKKYINRIVNDLVKQIENVCSVNESENMTQNVPEIPKNTKTNTLDMEKEVSCTNAQLTHDELNDFVKEQIHLFTYKFHLRVCPDTQEYILEEITDLLIDSKETIKYGNDDVVKDKIMLIITDYIKVSQHEAIYFTKNLLYNFKDIIKEPNYFSQPFCILQSSEQHYQTQNSTNDFSIEGVTDQDIQNNLDLYIQKIEREIEDWVSTIRSLDEIELDHKKAAIKDLACDIVDRHKYTELIGGDSNADELEYLKYQIFKWINKLASDDNLETIERASALMRRIHNIPVPMLTRPVQRVNTNVPLCCQLARKLTEKELDAKQTNTDTLRKDKKNVTLSGLRTRLSSQRNNMSVMEPISEVPRNTRRSNSAPGGYPMHQNETTSHVQAPGYSGSIQQNINISNAPVTKSQVFDDYEEYLQYWLQQIPINGNPEFVEKLRQGIYNGILKALAKLKMSPHIIDNAFYFKDVLAEEVEELLNCLPESPELVKKKRILISQLVEKTSEMQHRIINIPTPYKQQLVDNISQISPKENVHLFGDNAGDIALELLKIDLAEDFILHSTHRDTDKVKANVYKKKLMNHIQEFINEIKKAHGKDPKEIAKDFGQYKQEIMNALLRVPVPSEETMREQEDEVLLGFEIEQWFADLPLDPTEDYVEVLARKRHQDFLATKIHELEKQTDKTNSEDELRQLIRNFLKRLPLKEKDIPNVPFMVEELINRLKNRPKDYVAGAGVKNNANFLEPFDYDEFSREMQLCSSFSPDAKAQINQSSIIIRDGTRVKDDNDPPYAGQTIERNTPESQQQWVSLHETSARPSALFPRPNVPIRDGTRVKDDNYLPYAGQTVERNTPESQQQWVSLHETSARPSALFLRPNAQAQTYPISPSHDQDVQATPEVSSHMSNTPRRFMADAQGRSVSPLHEKQTIVDPVAHDFSFRNQLSNARKGWQDQSRNTSRLPEPNVSKAFSGGGNDFIQDSPRRKMLHGFPGSNRSLPVERTHFEQQPIGSQSERFYMQEGQHPSSSFKPTNKKSVAFPNASHPRPRGFSLPGNGFDPQYPIKTSETFPALDHPIHPPRPNIITLNGHPYCRQDQLKISTGPIPQGYLPLYNPNMIEHGPNQTQPGSENLPSSSGYFSRPPSHVPEDQNSKDQEAFGSQYPSAEDVQFHDPPKSFFSSPVRISIPDQNGSPPHQSRPRKRSRYIEKWKRDAVKRRLNVTSELEDEEAKCVCMERIWREWKRPGRCPCAEFSMEPPTYFPFLYPFPYFF